MNGEHEALADLRRDLVLELEAVNIYTEHYDKIQNPQVRALLAHIIEEEKEHVAEFMEMVKYLDEVQADEFTETHPQLVRQGKAQLIQSEESQVLQEQPVSAGTLTVGSLLGQAQ